MEQGKVRAHHRRRRLRIRGGAQREWTREFVLAGGSPMNPRVARRVLEMFNQFAPRKDATLLSQRELEILQLLVAGLIKKEIADRLNLSVHSVDRYIRRIYEKLEVNTRSAALAKALRQGLV